MYEIPTISYYNDFDEDIYQAKYEASSAYSKLDP